jgi:Alpha-acetolactate decarboxylase
MPRLDCMLSPGLWQLLQEHSQKTGQPVALIVGKALADYFDIAHHTLYQVSTATALVDGIYQGAVRVGTLREHGDLGLGTCQISLTIKKALEMQGPVIVGIPVDYRDNHRLMEICIPMCSIKELVQGGPK